MILTSCLNCSNKLSFCVWNILSSKSLGGKVQNVDFISMFNNIDFVILSETSKEIGIEVSEFKSIVQATSKVGKSGHGSSGGLVLLRLQNSPYFCVFKYARAVKQKVWNEAENRERGWGETLYRFLY